MKYLNWKYDMDILLLETDIIDLNSIREFRQQFTVELDKHVFDIQIRRSITLCLSEALNNLVEHATPSISYFKIHFYCNNKAWILDISDDGQAFQLSDHYDDNFLLTFSDTENGRGIALLHAQCDHLHYKTKTVPSSESLTLATPAKNKHNTLSLQWLFPVVKQRHTVLLVEDNDSLRLLYQHYLQQTFNVHTANNGYQAIEQLKMHKIDLILSDIRMPKMNGLSLRKRINEDFSKKFIPFIFITAENDPLVQQQANGLNIDDYIIKPVQKIQLLSIIHRVLLHTGQVYQQLTNRIDNDILASLKPNLPKSENGWRFQVACRDTGSGGGDFLMHKRFSKITQLLLTDIMGHDDSAKFFSHACSGYIHGLIQSMQENSDAGQILNDISQCSMSDQVLSKVTLTSCSLQLENEGKLSIASAGHPAPLLISANNISAINTSGVLPGLLENPQYKSTQLTVKKGQRIAIFTDGLFESAIDNNTRNTLKNEITQTLQDTLLMPIEQSLQQVMSLFDYLTNSRPQDDTLLLLIEPM
jgi:sigma-B regulation protein RsbU (phosphoserine phosphatase)